MKNKKKNFNIIKLFFLILLFSFSIVYFSELTGYYDYQNYKRKELTEEQIKQFENDIKEGNHIDLENYLSINNIDYSNKLSKTTSKISDSISTLVKKGVEKTFKYLSKLVNE